MGMFDSVICRCPKCDEPVEFQSKAGPCSLATHYPDHVPTIIALSINGHVRACDKCGVRLRIQLKQRQDTVPMEVCPL